MQIYLVQIELTSEPPGVRDCIFDDLLAAGFLNHAPTIEAGEREALPPLTFVRELPEGQPATVRAEARAIVLRSATHPFDLLVAATSHLVYETQVSRE